MKKEKVLKVLRENNPPATIVQTLPSGFNTVNFKDAPVEPSNFWIYASSFVNCLPNGAGQTMGGPRSAPITFFELELGPFKLGATTLVSRAIAHFGPQMLSAVWSSFAAISRK